MTFLFYFLWLTLQKHIPFVLQHFLLCCVLAVFDAVAQAPHDGEINLLFADLVFDTVVNARVVIHFDHDRVAVDFFEVNAVTLSIGRQSHLPHVSFLSLLSQL